MRVFFFLGFCVFCFLVEECCLWQQEKMKCGKQRENFLSLTKMYICNRTVTL